MKKKLIIVLSATVWSFIRLYSQDFITEKKQPGAFPIVSGSAVSPVYVDDRDYSLVKRAGGFLQNDIQMVTGKKPEILNTLPTSGKNMIIIGTLDKSALINRLVEEKKMNVDSLKGKWEGYKLQVVDKPFNGIENALVIVGSDKRGAAYGVFELS